MEAEIVEARVPARIAWVDTGKFICIMFVMLSHLESATEVLELFYSPFFLTAFFFLAGYVYNPPESFRIHLEKKARGLLVPWFIFSNLNILLSAVITLKGERNIGSELVWNLLQIRGLWDGVWFVAALFAAFIPFYFVVRWSRPAGAVLLSAVLSIASVLYGAFMDPALLPWNRTALPWHLEYIFQAMLWMVLGYYFKLYAERYVDPYVTGRNTVIIWGIYCAAAYIPSGALAIPLSYIRSMLGIAAMVFFCKRCRPSTFVTFVGANTLTYFALHGKVFSVMEYVLGRLAIYRACLENQWLSSLTAVLITILLAVILLIPAWIINRWFPWVLGRRKPGRKRE